MVVASGVLMDGVDWANLNALAAARAAAGDRDQSARVRPDRVLRAGEKACPAPLAGTDGHPGCHAYPRGVTILPATYLVVLAPTMTMLSMSTVVTSRSASVVRVTR